MIPSPSRCPRARSLLRENVFASSWNCVTWLSFDSSDCCVQVHVILFPPRFCMFFFSLLRKLAVWHLIHKVSHSVVRLRTPSSRKAHPKDEPQRSASTCSTSAAVVESRDSSLRSELRARIVATTGCVFPSRWLVAEPVPLDGDRDAGSLYGAVVWWRAIEVCSLCVCDRDSATVTFPIKS